MPTYDLACAACDQRFERFRQGFLRDEDRVCPACGSHDVTQLMTGFITHRPARDNPAPTVRAVSGGGCCGGACGGHG